MRFVVRLEKNDGSTLYMGRYALTADLDNAEVVSATMGDSYAAGLRNVENISKVEVVPVKLQLVK